MLAENVNMELLNTVGYINAAIAGTMSVVIITWWIITLFKKKK